MDLANGRGGRHWPPQSKRLILYLCSEWMSRIIDIKSIGCTWEKNDRDVFFPFSECVHLFYKVRAGDEQSTIRLLLPCKLTCKGLPNTVIAWTPGEGTAHTLDIWLSPVKTSSLVVVNLDGGHDVQKGIWKSWLEGCCRGHLTRRLKHYLVNR